MKAKFILIGIVFAYFSGLSQISPELISSYTQESKNGLPYLQGYSANYGVTSYFINEDFYFFLSSVDNKIRIFNRADNSLEKSISVTGNPKEIAFLNDQFYLLDHYKVNIFSQDGDLINTVAFSKDIKSVEKLQVIDGELYLLTNDQNTLILKDNKIKYHHDGWIINSDLYTRTIKSGKQEFILQVFSISDLISETAITTDKKLGSARVIGKNNQNIFIEIIYYNDENPLKTSRYISSFSLESKKLNDKPLQIPDVYFTYTKNDILFSENGFYYFLSSPQKYEVYNLGNQTKTGNFPAKYFNNPYHFNSHLLNSDDLEHADPDASTSKAPIYRSEIIGIAETFETHVWYCNPENIQDVACGGGQVTTPAWVEVGTNISLPYMWGGFTSLEQFDQGLLNGLCAGDMNTAEYEGTACSVGVDCSGFVSRAWNLPTKYGTSGLPSISTAYATFDELLPGDIVNLAGSHVRLVYTNNMDGTFLLLEATAAGAAWAVTYNTYTATAMDGSGYIPRYYNDVISDVVNPPTMISPLNTQSGINIPVYMDWTDVTGADNYRLQVSTSLSGWTAANGFTSLADPTSTVLVNKTTGTVSDYAWAFLETGVGTLPMPNTTYYWTVRVNVPGTGTSVYTHPRSFTTLADNEAPTTSISVNEWETANFSAEFTDEDNMAIKNRFYLVSDFNGTEWKANTDLGFFNEEYASLGAEWVNISGTWALTDGALNQADEASSNTNMYANVTQTGDHIYMYTWKMKIGGTGTNRRAGIYIFSDDASMLQRNNSYMIYYRVDNNTCQIYKSTADNIEIQTDDPITFNADTWYNCKVIFNPMTGVLEAYLNEELVSSWTDPDPHTSANAISFRSGNCNVFYDDVRVYHDRINSETVTIGAGGAARYQNPNPATAACKITTQLQDFGSNFSGYVTGLVNIDWTAPMNISFAGDGLYDDTDTLHEDYQIKGNWNATDDTHSGISFYEYCIGTTPGADDVVTWTNNGTGTNFTHTGLSLILDQYYYVSVRAVNGAGLYSDATNSNGAVVSEPLSISEISANSFKLYPNPARDEVFIESDEKILNIEIYTISGKLIENIVSTSEKTIRISMVNYQPGIYLIKLKLDNGRVDVGKIVKELP
ncbi:MAG: hypothetical protein A2W91_17150 [Bacteroidetes bacterium GWF2_38_335]|nr:MAG: hypothetical protein A2W91_17150 [Bacteroidetes bacterium GWF2_38_335]OFY81411.1 MAG: hypothetical protein A2281_08125 [Bacteroidetes bacterium RIFOXYA12_FULL_38_20]HBS85537.1 hypothetical protein [Bacteroidales bacterium]